MADTPRPTDKRQDEAANHPSWDRKQGTPKDQKTAERWTRLQPLQRLGAERGKEKEPGQGLIKLGYKLMSEEHGPADLVRNARRAEQAGFDFAAISDHYLPWLEEQGHAPFAWSVLGAHRAGDAAHRADDGGHLPDHALSPGDHRARRRRPWACCRDDRFTLGLGAGERLNEHVVGEGWPGVASVTSGSRKPSISSRACCRADDDLSAESISGSTTPGCSIGPSASPMSSWPRAAPMQRSSRRKRPMA